MSETDFSPRVDNVQLAELIANQAQQHTIVVKAAMKGLEQENPKLQNDPELKNLVQQYVGLVAAEKLDVDPESIVPPQQGTQTGHFRLKMGADIGVRKVEVFAQIKGRMETSAANAMRADIEKTVSALTDPIVAAQNKSRR